MGGRISGEAHTGRKPDPGLLSTRYTEAPDLMRLSTQLDSPSRRTGVPGWGPSTLQLPQGSPHRRAGLPAQLVPPGQAAKAAGLRRAG